MSNETLKKLSLLIGAINVNSFNVSTIGNRNSKTYAKIEGITSRKNDILFITDCRLGNQTNEIERLMGLNKNASYKLYSNSKMDSRGVAIAIKRNIFHEILEQFHSADQNIVLLRLKIKGVELVLGAIYGPNENNPEFYRSLREKVENWNLPFIIGGDFNTVLDSTRGEGNLDMVGGGGASPQYEE